MGCLIYEMLWGYPPFYTGKPNETYRKILDPSGPVFPGVKTHYHDEPTMMRPNLLLPLRDRDVLEHGQGPHQGAAHGTWRVIRRRSGSGSMRCLHHPLPPQHDPDQRLGVRGRGATEIKEHPWFGGLDFGYVLSKMYKPPHLPAARPGGDETSNFDDFTALGPLRHPFCLTAEQQAQFAAF